MSEDKLKNTMQDWRGTPFHVGDTIVFVRIKDGLDYRWDPYYETEVIDYLGAPYAEVPGPEELDMETVLFPIDLIFEMRDGSAVVFCIKGISENEEDFYKEFFWPKHMS